MEFIETSVFTKQVQEHLSDAEYRKFQEALILNPSVGNIIKNSGGLRKIRWNVGDSGKRGGVRIIYYWQNDDNVIFLLLLYRKNAQSDLSPKELKILRKIMETFL